MSEASSPPAKRPLNPWSIWIPIIMVMLGIVGRSLHFHLPGQRRFHRLGNHGFARQFALARAIALEPMGHIAGTASSLIGVVTMTVANLFAGMVGQAYDGTALPMVAGYFTVSVIGLVFVLTGERGVLFRRQNPRV